MTLEDRVRNALVALGPTPTDVYERLLAEGAFGRGCCGTCPVAVYLERVVGETVLVHIDYTSLIDTDFEPLVTLPLAVVQFLRRYDYRRQYQALRVL